MSARKMMVVITVILVVSVSAWSEEAPKPAFVSKPTVTREAEGYKIEFTVKDYCDVTVAIVNAEGKAIRHLVSGVLGRNPPAPLRKNSLKQVLYWDGKDDRGESAPGGCKVRISLGLKPEFERVLLGEKMGFRGPISAACGRDGTLYVADIPELGNIVVRAFDREGRYLRTVLPFPANMKGEHLNGLPLWKTDAGLLPIFFRGIRGCTYPFLYGARSYGHNDLREGMAVSSDGRVAMVSIGVSVAHYDYRQFLLRFRTDGSVPEPFVGPPLVKETGFRSDLKRRIELAFSHDEKSLYVSSLYDEEGKPVHAVYRVGWEDRDLPKSFVGDPAVAGKDGTHLNDPRGIAVGPGGNLYVADWGNNRIAVFASDGAFLRAITIDTPDQVAVHPKTGIIYVLCWAGKERSGRQPLLRRLVKLSAKGREVAEMTLLSTGGLAETDLALDPTAEPPILWLTNAAEGERLRKVVDKGGSLETTLMLKPEAANPWVQSLGTTQIAGLAVDREREEVYVRILKFEPAFNATGRLDGRTGKVEQLDFPVEVVGPEGSLYGRVAAPTPEQVKGIYGFGGGGQYLRRHDRQGRVSLFPAAEKGIHVPIYGDNATHWLCDFTVAPNGDLYFLRRSDKTGRQVDVYGSDGRLKREGLVTGLSNGSSDIEVDRDGAIYVLEHIKRKDQQVPTWAGKLASPLSFIHGQLPIHEGRTRWPPDPRRLLAQEWGSLLKFKPSGGKIHRLPANQFDGCQYIWEDQFLHKGGVSFEGLVWLGPGASRVVAGGCRCYSARFDQDSWGRSFVPQTHRFCVGVVDKAGNEITRIGSYGNFDSAGSESAIPVPEIPLWWPNWVGVSDSALYIADNANLRLVKVKLSYAAEETVEVR